MTGPAGEGLRRRATERIVFHATPRSMLDRQGPWLLVRGEGSLLWDSDGRQYLDALAGGVFAVLAGHGREEIAQAQFDQARTLAYTSPYGTATPVLVDLADKLAELAPGDLSCSFFCSSGSEAIEAAFKLAHQYHRANGQPQRHRVVSLRRAYHGATAAALSATGWSPGFGVFRGGLGPSIPLSDFTQAMPPYCHRCELGLTHPECNLACATAMEHAILGSNPDEVSAVVIEPVLGTGGCIIPPPGYLGELRRLCDQHGILLIADEVVCGFGRTGSWFGIDHAGIIPDIMVVAKGISSGYAPISAVITRPTIAEQLPAFWDVHTYGGHPASAAAALANLNLIETEGLVDHARTLGAEFLAQLQRLRRHRLVADVRGLGMLLAVELVDPPAAIATSAVPLDVQLASFAHAQGLFVRPLGGTILLGPPLVFTAEQVEQTVAILDAALSHLEGVLTGQGSR